MSKPIADVSVAGNSIISAVADYLLSLQVFSESGGASDRFSLTLSNHNNQIKWPGKAAEVAISMGYEATGLVQIGTFQVDHRGKSGPPSTIRARGTGARWVGKFKARKERSFHRQTLASILGQIASDHGLTAKIDPIYSGVTLKHFVQRSSDSELLTQLANRYGAIGKPDSGYLVFAQRYASNAPLIGLDFAQFQPQSDKVFRYDYDSTERPAVTGYRTYYFDRESATRKPYVAGGGDLVVDHQAQDSFSDKATAQAIADAKFRILSFQGEGLSVQIPGDPRFIAGKRLQVSNLDTDVDGRTWYISQAHHSFTQSGFRTRFIAHGEKVD